MVLMSNESKHINNIDSEHDITKTGLYRINLTQTKFHS